MKSGARKETQRRVTPGAPLVYQRRDSLNHSELPEQKLQSDGSSVIHKDNVVLRGINKLNDSKGVGNITVEG